MRRTANITLRLLSLLLSLLGLGHVARGLRLLPSTPKPAIDRRAFVAAVASGVVVSPAFADEFGRVVGEPKMVKNEGDVSCVAGRRGGAAPEK